MPKAAGDPELCSCTRSRTRLRTVARISLLGLRDGAAGVGEDEKENQLFFPFRLDTEDTEDDLACSLAGGELVCGVRKDKGACVS